MNTVEETNKQMKKVKEATRKCFWKVIILVNEQYFR